MLAVRLLILLVLVYLVFRIINILFSSSKTTRLTPKPEPLDQGEELVLCLQCQGYLPKLKLFFLTAIFPVGKSVPGFLIKLNGEVS